MRPYGVKLQNLFGQLTTDRFKIKRFGNFSTSKFTSTKPVSSNQYQTYSCSMFEYLSRLTVNAFPTKGPRYPSVPKAARHCKSLRMHLLFTNLIRTPHAPDPEILLIDLSVSVEIVLVTWLFRQNDDLLHTALQTI